MRLILLVSEVKDMLVEGAGRGVGGVLPADTLRYATCFLQPYHFVETGQWQGQDAEGRKLKANPASDTAARLAVMSTDLSFAVALLKTMKDIQASDAAPVSELGLQDSASRCQKWYRLPC